MVKKVGEIAKWLFGKYEDIEYNDEFNIENITDIVQSKKEEIKNNIEMLKKYIEEQKKQKYNI